MIKLKNILNESFQKRHFLNLIKQEINSLKGQIAYAKDKVNYKGTEDWERKEFKGVLKDLLKKLKDTEKHYKRVQKLKEGKLKEGHTVKFSKDEMAKLHKDGSIEKDGHTYVYSEGKIKEAKGFESKDGKHAIKQYQKLYKNVIKGEKYLASSVDNLADFMEQQGLKNQSMMLKGNYLQDVRKWVDKWLKQFVRSLK